MRRRVNFAFELAIFSHKFPFLDPSQPVYKMNTAATFLEEKKYEECRKSCFEAMDVARENKGLPNKISLIAKTLARIGTSYAGGDSVNLGLFSGVS